MSLSLSSARNHVDRAEPNDLIPARMLNEYVYCPRLFFLEWVQGEWEDSEDTIKGKAIHNRVDRESGKLPAADDFPNDEDINARSVMLSAPKLGLIAKIDLVEGQNGEVTPVDYKKGAPSPHGPWEPHKVQLCAQALVLKENGYRCEEGILYYASVKKRISVPFDKELLEKTLNTIEQAKAVADKPMPPPPLVDSPKCPRCSLVGICLPDEVSFLRGAELQDVRRLVPARDDAAPVYVQDQGAFIGKSGERLVIRRKDAEDVDVRFLDVSQVSLYGNVQISAQALRELIARGIPVFHHTYGGWLVSVTTGVLSQNIELRMRQYEISKDTVEGVKIARAIVAGKIRNQRTLLRRNHRGSPCAALGELARLARMAYKAGDLGKLLGIEGMAARIYFSHFAGMLVDSMGFDESGRQRRPPPDPINTVLSFLYSVLLKDAIKALLAVGLDPYCGIYHRLRPGRPSLGLDLMEEFRPLVCDSVTISLVNNRILKDADFIRRGGSCALKDGARRQVLRAYEARMDTLVRHPIFGYQASYRRTLEIQARLLARTIAGEITEYRPFVTR